MQNELYNLPFTDRGLEIVFEITLGLRRAGYKTRLVIDRSSDVVYTVVATPPKRPNRKARGAIL